MNTNFIIAISFLSGFALAMALFPRATMPTDAILGIDDTNPNRDTYKFVILCPLEDLKKKRYIRVEIKKVSDGQPE